MYPSPSPMIARTIALAIVGSLSAVIGGRLLSRLPDGVLVCALVIVAAVVLFAIRRSRRSGRTTETVAQTLLVTAAGAVAGAAAERWIQVSAAARPVVAGVLVGVVLVALLWIWTRGRRMRAQRGP